MPTITDYFIAITSSPPVPGRGETLSQALTVDDDEEPVYTNASGHNGQSLSQALTVSSDGNASEHSDDESDPTATADREDSSNAANDEDHDDGSSNAADRDNPSSDNESDDSTSSEISSYLCTKCLIHHLQLRSLYPVGRSPPPLLLLRHHHLLHHHHRTHSKQVLLPLSSLVLAIS